MSKAVHCRDVGFDCDGVVRAETEEEVMQGVARHARDAHGVDEITPEIEAQVRSVMHDDPMPAA